MTDKSGAVAYLHTLHMEFDQTCTLLTHRNDYGADEPRRTAFGLPGRDYSEEYTVTTIPLYAHPSSQDASALVEALRPFAKFVDKETCTITMIWEDGDYRSHYPNVLKPLDFFNARAALSEWEQSNADPEALRPQG